MIEQTKLFKRQETYQEQPFLATIETTGKRRGRNGRNISEKWEKCKVFFYGKFTYLI